MIYPTNEIERVDRVLAAVQASGDEIVVDREGEPLPFRKILTEKANLFRVTRKLLTLIAEKSGNANLQELLHPAEKEALKTYLGEADFLSLIESVPTFITPQTLCDHLGYITPRYYSISSSINEVKDEAHLTVAATGFCSDFLCHKAPTGAPVIGIKHHSSDNFYLPADSFSKPIIMIGPGTGVAPFRGFLQERRKNFSKENWLFFGERTREHDFYYKDFFEELCASGFLELDLAFSRDTAEKVYVQHKIYEKRKRFIEWLEKGAYLFVCGDKEKMAKSVDQIIHQILEEEGHDAKLYVKKLKEENRYLRDVY